MLLFNILGLDDKTLKMLKEHMEVAKLMWKENRIKLDLHNCEKQNKQELSERSRISRILGPSLF